MKIKYALISKKGHRSNNEDAVRVLDEPDKGRWMGVVCDGLGGHLMGDVAGEVVSDAIIARWGYCNDEDSADKVKRICRYAMQKLNDRAACLNSIKMGTTLVMASIKDKVATIAHCGDSRCYMLRGGEMLYQTVDHVSMYFGREKLNRCFFSGHPNALKVDVEQFELESGDRILLCSDGLYKSIAPEILKARVMDDKTPAELLDVFDFLCEKNGDDNYTAILAIVE